jgi:thiol-disulfide isomerase/thioredoxin
MRSTGRRTATLGVVVSLVLTAGCTFSSDDDGDGRSSRFVTVVAPEDREILPTLEGPDLDGRQLSTADFDGNILVVNLWGPWCAPCRAEAPVLRAVSDEYAAKKVQFVGIVNDASDDWSRRFNTKRGISYPQFSDQGGALELAFQDTLPTVAVPTTWVIDSTGRVAARILDQDLSASTLTSVLDEILAEEPSAPA